MAPVSGLATFLIFRLMVFVVVVFCSKIGIGVGRWVGGKVEES